MMNNALRSPGSFAHAAAICALAMVSGGCYRSHTLDVRLDGSVDAGIADAHPLDLSDDANHVDLGDPSIDMAISECPTGLAGTWFRTFVRSSTSCLSEDGFIDLTSEGLPVVEADICSQVGCTADTCTVTVPRFPDCTAGLRFETPCARLPRGVSSESSYRFLSATRFEGTMTMYTAAGSCVDHVVGTR